MKCFTDEELRRGLKATANLGALGINPDDVLRMFLDAAKPSTTRAGAECPRCGKTLISPEFKALAPIQIIDGRWTCQNCVRG